MQEVYRDMQKAKQSKNIIVINPVQRLLDILLHFKSSTFRYFTARW